MNASSGSFNLKSQKALLQTLLFLLLAFCISALSLLLGYVLKNINPLEYGLIRGDKQDLEVTYKEILFFASVVIAFFVLSLAFRYVKHHNARRALIITAIVYLSAAAIMVLADVIHYLIFACRITFSSFQTILNTNPEEVKDFLKLYSSPGCIGALLAFAAVLWLVVFKRSWFIHLFSTTPFFIASFLISAFGVIDFIQVAHSKGNGTHNMRYWDIIIGEYNEYRAFNRKLAAEKNNQDLSEEYTGFYKQDTAGKTLVLVISESLSKRHMSLYGYARPTTPMLAANKDLFKFNDCVSSAALTIDAVPGLFFNGYFSRRINLISLLNRLNYRTYWLSNQSGWGKTDGTIVLLSQLCHKTVFLDALADNDKANGSVHYDEEIISRFNEVLRDSGRSKLIVLHLMGCHFDYEKRYPVDKTLYTAAPPAQLAVQDMQAQKIVNSYDNAMHYHDSVVNRILHLFSEQCAGKNAALMFLSDHGEELYEHRNHAGHGYPPIRATAEVPYFMLLSPRFKKNYPAIEPMMKQRMNTPYSTANNFFTTLQLLNITAPNYKDRIQKNAFFSPAYDSTRARMVMGLDYKDLGI